MPDITTAINSSIRFVVIGNCYFIQNTLGSYNLVRTHCQQQFVGSENAIFSKQIEQGMFGKESTAKVHQIGNGAVVGISPPRSKFKTVAGAFAFLYRSITQFSDMRKAGGIAIIFGISAV